MASLSLPDVTPATGQGSARSTTALEGEGRHAISRPRSAPSSPHAGRRLLAGRTSRATSQRSHSRFKTTPGGSRQCTPRRAQRTFMSIPEDRTTPIMVVETPAYTLSRSPSRLQMNINTSAFFGKNQQKQHTADESKPCPPHPTTQPAPDKSYQTKKALEKCLMTQKALEMELTEMAQKMQEEKECHEEQMKQLSEEYESEKQKLSEKYNKGKSKVKEEHDYEVAEMKRQHSEGVQELALIHESELSMLRREMDLEKEEHISTSAQQLSEAQEKLQQKEQELLEQQAVALYRQEASLRAETEDNEQVLRQKLESEHKEELAALAQTHRKEQEALLSQFMDVAKLEEELAQRKKHVTKCERRISRLREELEGVKSQLTLSEAKHHETQVELQAFQINFKDEVRKVDEQFQSRMDTLMLENSQLRCQIIHKTEEFWRYKTAIERSQSQILRDFGDRVKVVVQARKVAGLSVAVGLVAERKALEGGVNQEKVRPVSAPMTASELSMAKMRASEQNSKISLDATTSLSLRPHTRS